MIYYLGYYNCDQIRSESRLAAPATENKMKYILSALTEACDEEITVVSPAQTKLCRFVKGRKLRIGDNVVLKTFSSFNSKNKLVRIFGHLLTRLNLIYYLLKNVNKDDHLVVYHSLVFMNILKLLKKYKKFGLTIEVEELYSDVTENEEQRKKEIEYLQIADSYIFITELLRKEVNDKKPFAISHGTYSAVSDLGFSFNDDKVHVVYAGTFRKAKGGAFTAIPVAQYLDENYVLEILGSGSKEEVEEVKKEIEEVSKESRCMVNYVGFKSGDDFNSYIQACHIGLSTQLADAKFNATSFPSKVLMYMSNGLRVVSVRIPAIETSKVGEHIYYYDEQNAEEIAKVIKSVQLVDEYDSRKVLDVLHKDFVKQFNSLLHR
ncbi:MAG: glycosyltransferase [Ruminococcus sp.]|nr:glycosyltransferase [Ruminococcus sp.]